MAMIVALARKLLIALWRMARTGEVPEGVRVDGTAGSAPNSRSGSKPRQRPHLS